MERRASLTVEPLPGMPGAGGGCRARRWPTRRGRVARALRGLLLSLWVSGAAAADGAATGGPLRAAALPLQSREATVREFSKLFRAVGEAVGRPVEFVYLDRYEAVLDDLLAGRLDVAYLGPMPYVELMRRNPEAASPLVRFREADGSSTYRCALVSFPDNPLRWPDVAGSRLAMPQALSTCGPHSAGPLLARLGGPRLDVMKTHFSGQHEIVAQQVVAGHADLGTLKQSVATAYRVLGLRILATTDPLPGFLLVVRNAAMPVAQRGLLRERLMAWPTQAQRQWGKSVRWGLEPASDADYDTLRALAKAGPP